MSDAYPETPDAIAWELTLAIAEAEGRPIRRAGREPKQEATHGMNQSPRSYYLGLYAACREIAYGRASGEAATVH